MARLERGREAVSVGHRQGSGGGAGITQGLVGHKDFDFYSELNQEPLVGSEQRGNMISVVAVETLRRLSQEDFLNSCGVCKKDVHV